MFWVLIVFSVLNMFLCSSCIILFFLCFCIHLMLLLLLMILGCISICSIVVSSCISGHQHNCINWMMMILRLKTALMCVCFTGHQHVNIVSGDTKSRGLGQARPKPSCEWWLWLGPGFQQAKAASSQAKAGAFGPSGART